MRQKIILIITGSIAAPKGYELYCQLTSRYDVELIMTKSAGYFFHDLPAAAHTDVFTHEFYDKTVPSNHIELVRDAQLMLVYPATANFLAKVRVGLSDDLASIVFLAFDGHKVVQPAMNTKMYLNPITQDNLQTLQNYGVEVLEPKSGLLACNTVGPGRAWEPADMAQWIDTYFEKLPKEGQ